MSIDFPPNFKIFAGIPLSEHTNIKIGGKTDYLINIFNQTELIDVVRFCQDNDLRLRVLGSGSNVFFSDSGFRGVVAIAKFDQIKLQPGNVISVEAGVTLSTINDLCISESLTGFEFSAGIPGTVGGAIYGNAGAYGKAIGDCLIRAKIITTAGEVKWVKADYFLFSYRNSELKRNSSIVLEVKLQLDKGNSIEIKKKINDILELRRQKLPPEKIPTAGSYFKNLKDNQGGPIAAAKYLDAIGSKSISVGDAAVYHGHANILINKGSATAQDMLMLEKILKQKVLDKFGILLEREVMYIK